MKVPVKSGIGLDSLQSFETVTKDTLSHIDFSVVPLLFGY